jgi:integrase
MSLYKRVTCAKGGTCNTKGRNAKCSKCGKQREGGAWWYRFRFGGRIIHESSRSQSLTIAREAEKQRRRQLEESWNQITRRTLPPPFDKAAGEWLKGREGRVAPSTLRIGKMAIAHLAPAFGDKLLCDIAPRNIEAYQQGRLREGAQGRTINIEVQALAQILKANKCWQHLAGEIRSLRERKGIGRALTPEEESLLLARCTTTDSACYTATVLALNSTMRKDEIRKLRWNQVDLFEGILTVGKSKTEAGTGRVIPLNPAARRALADWGNRFPGHKPEHYVFPWCESRIIDLTEPTKGWRTAWRTATRAVECPKCGLLQRPTKSCQNDKCKADMHDVKSPLAGLRFHDLRHTAITKLAESQASDQTIMAIAGHVSRQMLEHYSHIRMAAKRAALDSISTPLPDDYAGERMVDVKAGVHQNDNQIKMHRKQAGAKSLI